MHFTPCTQSYCLENWSSHQACQSVLWQKVITGMLGGMQSCFKTFS